MVTEMAMATVQPPALRILRGVEYLPTPLHPRLATFPPSFCCLPKANLCFLIHVFRKFYSMKKTWVTKQACPSPCWPLTTPPLSHLVAGVAGVALIGRGRGVATLCA